jgi:hypothetical protein
MWSFSGDTVVANSTGAHLGSRTFTGFEILNISYSSALGAAYQLDVWAHSESGIVQNINSVSKIAF